MRVAVCVTVVAKREREREGFWLSLAVARPGCPNTVPKIKPVRLWFAFDQYNEETMPLYMALLAQQTRTR